MDGMRLACLRKLRTPFSFCPRVGEMEKLGRSWLPTEVRGEPACCQGETGLSLQSPPAQLVLPPPGPVRQQDVVVGLEAAGGAIMGLVPRAGMRSQLGLPKHQHFQCWPCRIGKKLSIL